MFQSVLSPDKFVGKNTNKKNGWKKNTAENNAAKGPLTGPPKGTRTYKETPLILAKPPPYPATYVRDSGCSLMNHPRVIHQWAPWRCLIFYDLTLRKASYPGRRNLVPRQLITRWSPVTGRIINRINKVPLSPSTHTTIFALSVIDLYM